jgi:hypothetical protein
LEHSRQTEDKEKCWRDGKQDKAFTLLLAALLVYSRLLPHGQDYVPYGVTHLQYVLSRLPSFSFSLITVELDKLNGVWQRCQRYRVFLAKNQIGGWQPHVREVLQRVEIPGDSEQLDRAREVLIWMGERAIRTVFQELPDVVIEGEGQALRLVTTAVESEDGHDLVHTLSLISMIIFITEELTESLALREPICRQAAAMTKSPYINLSYLEFREQLRRNDELDGRKFLDINYLVRNWANKAKERRDKPGKGFQEEIEAISNSLREGEWLPRLPTLLDRTYNNILKKNNRLLKKLAEALRQRPAIREPLETVFKDLSIDTIARFLESKKRIAYLLTFRVREGTFAYLLDCLVSSEDNKIRQLQKHGVILQSNGQSKYNFRQYTNSARIGIVPAGLSFDKFSSTFQKDLEEVIKARADLLPPKMLENELDDLKDIEVIVSQFDLSGGSRYWFKYEGVTKQRAQERVRELFAGVLSEDELAMLIEYEGYEKHADRENLADAIMVSSITDLIGSQLSLNKLEREALDRENQRLRQEMTDRHNCMNIRELGRVLRDDKWETKRAINMLAELLEDVLEFDPANRRMNIAKVYITTLASVARISN